MMNELHKHRWAYMVLVILLTGFVVGFMAAWPNRMVQRWLILTLGGSYFMWGISTHFKSKKITSTIIFEYAGIALLATTLLLLVTW